MEAAAAAAPPGAFMALMHTGPGRRWTRRLGSKRKWPHAPAVESDRAVLIDHTT